MQSTKPEISSSNKPVPHFHLVLLLCAFVLAYFPVWRSLIQVWYSSEEYSHGFLIVPVCCYLIWVKRETLSKLTSTPSSWGLALILVSLLLYLLGYYAEITTLASTSMVPFLAGAAIYLFGFALLKELSFPLFLLLFMIPIPSQIYSSLTIPLQLFVSKASVHLAATIGIPIYREGNIIHLPDLTLQVVTACSGLRSMVSLWTLAAILGYFTLRTNLLRVILFVSSTGIAILVNVVRVLAVVLSFYYAHYDLTHGTAHTLLGMAVFGLAFCLLLFFRGVLFRWDSPAPRE